MSIRLAFAAGIAIIILGLASGLFYYRGNAIAARAEAAQTKANLATAVAINAENEKTVAKLKADKEASDKLAADLADEVAAANQSALNLATTLADLRSKNADVDSYLRQPVPPALRGLYDAGASGDKNSHP
jgi:hypothetical protein